MMRENNTILKFIQLYDNNWKKCFIQKCAFIAFVFVRFNINDIGVQSQISFPTRESDS